MAITSTSRRDRRLFLALLVLLPLFGTETPGAETASTTGVTQLGPGVAVDVSKHEVYLDATVCMRRGILEYLICAKHTFEHESVFATEGKASHLHLGLLLIGGEPYPYSPTPDWPDQVRQHPAAKLTITVEFDDQGVLQRRKLSQFARNREREDGVVADSWAFAGSVFYERDGKEYYAADSTGGIIGLMYKGASVVQYAENIGVPYHGENQGMEANGDAIPPAGTAVRVIFTRVPAPAPPAPSAPSAPAVVTDQPSTIVEQPSGK